MISVLANPTYRRLFMAQVIALVGTGLATVALGLLAFDLAGADAGTVLGTALAIKMVAYIGVAPIVGALADQLPRRALLVAMDVVRAAVAMLLPFIDQVWQIYVLIFALQSASAAFTPTFQATIPDILPDEREYTRALSLSRLAYDLESLASPAVAAALLTVTSFHWVFSGTAVGFMASALLVAATPLPSTHAPERMHRGIYARTFRGIRIYLKTPRLRGLLALTFASAAASSMVIVNSVVIVQGLLGRPEHDLALTLSAYGAGSILAALALSRLLERLPDRAVMIGAGAVLTGGLVAMAVLAGRFADDGVFWTILLVGWFVLGFGYSMSVTPAGRLLRRSAGADDRPALFAAQFALSHACWLVTYPLAGWIGAGAGQVAAFTAMAGIGAAGTGAALWLWPRHDPIVVPHRHDNLSADDSHLLEGHSLEGEASHAFVIDDRHLQWPR